MAAAPAGAAPSSPAIPVDLDAVWRGPGDAVGETHWLQVDAPARGLLTFDLSTPGAVNSRAVLVAVEQEANGPPILARRTSAGVVIGVRDPGNFRFLVAAEDPRQALPAYKARVGFAEHGDLRAKDEDNGEVEVDPDPFVSCAAPPPSLKDEDNGEVEVDPDPLTACAYDLVSAMLDAKLSALCRQGEVDDHGDTFYCATRLAVDAAVAGEIGNAWGDDEDVFRFQLAAPRTVKITSGGATDTAGELYDRFGHRLTRDDDGDGDGHFRIVRVLGPGTYFVRVEGGHGAAGPYTIAVATVTR